MAHTYTSTMVDTNANANSGTHGYMYIHALSAAYQSTSTSAALTSGAGFLAWHVSAHTARSLVLSVADPACVTVRDAVLRISPEGSLLGTTRRTSLTSRSVSRQKNFWAGKVGAVRIGLLHRTDIGLQSIGHREGSELVSFN